MFLVVWGRLSNPTLYHFDRISESAVGFPQSFPIFNSHLSIGEDGWHPESYILPLLSPGLMNFFEPCL